MASSHATHAAAGHGAHGGGHDHGHASGEPHLVPLGTYFLVFTALMGLLIITLAAAAFDLGSWNLPLAMAIAVAKAMLIFLFFMHLKWSSPLVRVFAWCAFFWLGIMFMLTLMDYTSRGVLSPIYQPAPVSAPAVPAVPNSTPASGRE